MSSIENPTNDPHPWLHVDYDGSEARISSAQDENGEVFRGWIFSPRPKSVWERLVKN